MTLQEKIKKIVSAIKSGISIYKLDPIGKGSSAKMLIQGKMPTQKKILQMFTNLLVIEQSSKISIPTDTDDDNDCIRNEKLKLSKLKVILEAANSGVPLNIIDPLGGGSSVRRLLHGGNPSSEKTDRMYDNVLNYQQKQLLQTKEQFIILNPHDNPDNEGKKSLILQAVSSGIQKCKIDTAGGGKSISRLQKGKGVLQVTLDMMYSNLLSLMGYSQDSSSATVSARQSQTSLQIQLNGLQNIVAAMADKIKLLETAVSVLQNIARPQSNTPDKILGTTLILKDDIIRGKKYRRWYALFTDNLSKRHWIYIGNNVDKAKDKIISWFSQHPELAPKSATIPFLS